MINRLGETYQPIFGQASLWVVLLVGGVVLGETNLQFSNFERGVPVSILGYLIPEQWLSNPEFFFVFKVAYIFFAIVWAVAPFLGRLPEKAISLSVLLASSVTVVSYTVVASMFWENLPFFLHKYVLPFWLLLIHALWYHFYGNEIRSSIKARTFWRSPIYPYWVFFLSVFVISMLYTFAGLSKLRASAEWGNGLSMQLWTQLFADPNSPITDLILADRSYAAFVQTFTLFIECLAWIAIFNRYLRIAIGIGLIAMHFAVDITFHVDFVAYMILLVVYFLPLFEFGQKAGVDLLNRRRG